MRAGRLALTNSGDLGGPYRAAEQSGPIADVRLMQNSKILLLLWQNLYFLRVHVFMWLRNVPESWRIRSRATNGPFLPCNRY